MRRGDKQEYGKMEIDAAAGSGLFGGAGGRQVVWMSHGDEVVRLPQGFEVVARSDQGTVAAVEDKSRRLYGLQYHPEVYISKVFIPNVCSCSRLTCCC